MSQRLIAAGHRVTMISGMGANSPFDADQGGARVEELDVDGIRALCVREPYANRMSLRRRALAFFRFARTAGKLVAGLDADLVFATSTPLTVGLPGMKGAKALGVPLVFEVRDLWPELPIVLGAVKNPLLKWYLRRLERRIYSSSRHVVALAPGIKEGICATGYPEHDVSIIPNSSDLDLFRPDGGAELDGRFGSSDEFRLAFTGAHGIANGLDAVLDAIALLKRRGATGIRFVFIGDGRLKPALVARSHAEGLDELISWVDPMPKDELARVLPSMDAGMMILKNVPAFYKGTSPNKFFDYISCGLPVLNNYPGWLADHITESQCGLVVPPDDPEAFADAVMTLARKRDDLSEMGGRSRELAEREFARDLLAERFVEVLERVHEKSRRM